MASVKMAGFPPEFIQELKSRNDIVSVISQYVPLTRKGSKYFCCCPFHNEKTPSMCVNTDGQYYHCFGCGVTGDIITFIMEMESLAYPDADELFRHASGFRVHHHSNEIRRERFASPRAVLRHLRATGVTGTHDGFQWTKGSLHAFEEAYRTRFAAEGGAEGVSLTYHPVTLLLEKTS